MHVSRQPATRAHSRAPDDLVPIPVASRWTARLAAQVSDAMKERASAPRGTRVLRHSGVHRCTKKMGGPMDRLGTCTQPGGGRTYQAAATDSSDALVGRPPHSARTPANDSPGPPATRRSARLRSRRATRCRATRSVRLGAAGTVVRVAWAGPRCGRLATGPNAGAPAGRAAAEHLMALRECDARSAYGLNVANGYQSVQCVSAQDAAAARSAGSTGASGER